MSWEGLSNFKMLAHFKWESGSIKLKLEDKAIMIDLFSS